LDGNIYVTGGRLRSGDFSDALEAYDPVANTWTTLSSLSEARMLHSSAAFNGKLCVFAGCSPDYGRTDLVEVYNPASDNWGTAADVPNALESAVAVAL